MNDIHMATIGMLCMAALIGIINYIYWKRVGKVKKTLDIQMPLVVCVLSMIGIWVVVFSGILAINILI